MPTSANGSVPHTADVVVIGGGVNGASTAFQLAKRGAGKVVLLERGLLAAGASGKSGALVRCHYANPHEAALTQESLRIFQRWDDEVGHGSPGFEAVGFVQVVSPEDEAHLRANVAAQQAVGVETHVVDAKDLRAIEPLLRTDDLTYAAFEPGAGYADPNATVHAFAAAAQARGATILTETEATAIRIEGDAVAGVETSRGPISSRAVVLAGGAYTDRLLGPLGLDFGLTPKRAQVVVFRWPAEVDHGRKHVVVIDAVHHTWLRPEGAFNSLIGLETPPTAVDPDAYAEAVDPDYVGRARAALAARLPAVARGPMRGGWAGVYTGSPDGHPIIDQIPSVPGLWLMAGDSGTSFKTAPAIGICLAQWVLDGAPTLVDLTPFRSTRFAEGAMWLDEHAYGDDRVLSISR
jgi:sarcosine oxidase subunit beta